MQYTINVRGRLVDLSQPMVMGILNATPDSFYSGSRKQTEAEIAEPTKSLPKVAESLMSVPSRHVPVLKK